MGLLLDPDALMRLLLCLGARLGASFGAGFASLLVGLDHKPVTGEAPPVVDVFLSILW